MEENLTSKRDTVKDEAALNEFLQNEVNLNQTRYDNAQDRLKTLRNHLRDNLEGFRRNRNPRFVRNPDGNQTSSRQ